MATSQDRNNCETTNKIGLGAQLLKFLGSIKLAFVCIFTYWEHFISINSQQP